MRSSTNTRWFLFFAFSCFLLATWLRFDQLIDQVLIEDEWHAIHQITYYSVDRIVTSFGNADYSIPITLLYWLYMQFGGVSELAMRLPMAFAGVATVFVVPLAMRHAISDRVFLLGAMLLASSAFLISWSRIARPYALTLLGCYLAFWALQHALRGERVKWLPAAGYSSLCGFVVWLHVLTGPMLVAPIILLWCQWVVSRIRGVDSALPARDLLLLSLMTGVLMSMAVLPPLVGDIGALTGKSGVDSPNIETIVGAAFLWLGTESSVVAAIALAFAVLGARTMWRVGPIVHWLLLGLCLTLFALLFAKPWWVDRPLALARYLLPGAPLLLMSIAAGITVFVTALSSRAGTGRTPHFIATGLTVILLVSWWWTSPQAELLERPNSYTQHSYFQYDYRRRANPIRIGLPTMPTSSFWSSLSQFPKGSVTVAIAPFRYSTYEWPAPHWERLSGQRVIPAFLWGTCMDTRHGEVPPDARFDFRNAVHIARPESMSGKGVNYLGYYRIPPFALHSAPLPQCEAWMLRNYGAPDYEDESLVIWRIPRKLTSATKGLE